MLWILIYAYCRQRHLTLRWHRTQAFSFFYRRRTVCTSQHLLSSTSFINYVWHLQMTKYKITTLPNAKFQREIMFLISNVIKHLWTLSTFFIHSSWIIVLELQDCESKLELIICYLRIYVIAFYLHLDGILCNESNDCLLGRWFELSIALAAMVCSEDKPAHSQSETLCSGM